MKINEWVHIGIVVLLGAVACVLFAWRVEYDNIKLSIVKLTNNQLELMSSINFILDNEKERLLEEIHTFGEHQEPHVEALKKEEPMRSWVTWDRLPMRDMLQYEPPIKEKELECCWGNRGYIKGGRHENTDT